MLIAGAVSLAQHGQKKQTARYGGRTINFELNTVFPVNGKVAADRYAIGYAGLAYMDEQLKLLGSRPGGGGPYIAPSYEEVARPIIR